MGNDESALTRRDWLVTGGVALSELALTAASGGAETAMRQVRARLSLNENPFGPSPFALAGIRNQLGEVCRYTDDGGDALTQPIVAR
jgi:histidinol-phosphate aminotransferase